MIEDEIRRATKLLATLVQIAGLNRQDLDRRLGQGRGYSNQLLTGRVELKYRHILAILRGLGLEPRVFFRSLFPEPGEAVGGARMLERLFSEIQRSGYGSYLAAPPAPVPSPGAIDADELDRRIQMAVSAALAERERKEASALETLEITAPRSRMRRAKTR
jgi:hypothetical protein